jgi:hypothetical protein
MEVAQNAMAPWGSTKEHLMKREQMPLYAIALAVLVVGLVYAGVPLGTVVVLPLILACPLMMFFMMRGMGGMGHGGMSQGHDQSPTKPGVSPDHESAGR